MSMIPLQLPFLMQLFLSDSYNASIHSVPKIKFEIKILWRAKTLARNKVGCVFPMVISFEFCMGQYIDDDHREYAPHFR